MDNRHKIESALTGLGIVDVLDWARRHATLSLFELNRMLGAVVPPVDLKEFLADAARQARRYDDFVRVMAVRCLRENFPEGLGKSAQSQSGLANAWAMWVSPIDPMHRETAKEVWDRIEAAMRRHPDWCPGSPDDPRLAEAFEGRSFEWSEGARRLALAVTRMEEEIGRDNKPFAHVKAAQNVRRVPRGYGWLYGLYAVHGQVCNGGFEQYYQNTGGWPTVFALEALREMKLFRLADIRKESLASALVACPESVAAEIETQWTDRMPARRSLEELDEAYYEAIGEGDPGWFEIATAKLVATHPEDFE